MNETARGPARKPIVVDIVLTPTADSDSEELDRWTRELRNELEGLDIQSANLASSGAVTAGAKASDPVTIGAIVVALSVPGGVLVTLVETLREWLTRHATVSKISITINGDPIELDHATTAQQHNLVKLYLQRHMSEPPGP